LKDIAGMTAPHALPNSLLAELSNVLAARAGWHFPPERWPELERRIHAVARDFDFADTSACIRWLTTSSLTTQQVEVLADHFTVGETYFFREGQALDVFTERILPSLVQARQQSTRSLRIWSAACCTGEEPYSLAILLSSHIPNIQDWQVTILGTDINPRFLKKANAGVYSEWSFRTTPPHLKERYFQRTGNGNFTILPEIRRMVRFSQLNLVESTYPSFVNNTNDMDVIFCRNVFIYFSPDHIYSAVANFHRALVDGGWLIVSPSETAYLPPSLFVSHSFPGTIIHQKKLALTHLPLSSTAISAPSFFLPSHSPASLGSAVSSVTLPTEPHHRPPSAAETLAVPFISQALPAQSRAPVETTESTLYREAEMLYKEGRYDEVCDKLQHALWHPHTRSSSIDPQIVTLLVRAYANQGAWDNAIVSCQKATELDPFNLRLHYLLATLLSEQDRDDDARVAFKRILYLAPDFAIAHFSLANLARRQNRIQEMHRHLRNAHNALRHSRPDDLVPEAEGLTVQGLRELIAGMLAKK
jgi:chemotaxis protein methyltransferase CheR